MENQKNPLSQLKNILKDLIGKRKHGNRIKRPGNKKYTKCQRGQIY